MPENYQPSKPRSDSHTNETNMRKAQVCLFVLGKDEKTCDFMSFPLMFRLSSSQSVKVRAFVFPVSRTLLFNKQYNSVGVPHFFFHLCMFLTTVVRE
jgi:hypothetical protein